MLRSGAKCRREHNLISLPSVCIKGFQKVNCRGCKSDIMSDYEGTQ